MFASPFDPASGEPGIPVELFRRPAAGQRYNNSTVGYDVSPDGQRFFLVIPQDNAEPSTVVLVLNWPRDLEQAVPRYGRRTSLTAPSRVVAARTAASPARG